ncbi:MAG: peptidoglycan-binding domain-containing protein [Acidimicrobiia bacterium]|nr:peptidoglycan-binding domain-containing protein [Acidimicrobiia bacterium]
MAATGTEQVEGVEAVGLDPGAEPTLGSAPDETPARSANDTAGDDLDALLGAGRRRRRWPWLLAGLAIGTGATVAIAQQLGAGDAADPSARTETVTLSTATVERRDLVEQLEYAAELGYGDSVSIFSSIDGTLTSVVEPGASIGRGDVIADVDGAPLVAMFAPSPFWRDLEIDDDGEDVRALEANLVALGYDLDGDLTVDTEFTAATAAAVERWEEAYGLEPTGELSLGRVVALPGDAVVVERADAGADIRAGQSIATVQVTEATTDVVGSGEGDVTDIVSIGTRVAHGDILWRLDGQAVAAVVDAGVVAETVIGVATDGDVVRLEETLVFFGFDPEGLITIDDTGDLATVAAIARFQQSIGMEQTGVLDARHYLLVAPDRTVRDVFVAEQESVDRSTLFLTLGTPTLVASADVAAEEIDDFELGDTVVVETADGALLDAVLVRIADVADPPAAPDDSPTIEVAFELVIDGGTDAALGLGEIVAGPATVLVEAARIEDALVVPTRALLSLSEGGFAVEVRTAAGANQLVAIELGTFDDGVVEISSGDITVGDEVVVPS